MSHKVTQCAGCISAKSRPHQLHWEMVTHILCRKSCLYAFTSLVPRPSTPPVFDCLQHVFFACNTQKNKCYIKLELVDVSHLLKNIVSVKTHRIHNAQMKLQCAVSPTYYNCEMIMCVMCLHGEKPHTARVCHSTKGLMTYCMYPVPYGHIPCTYDSSPHLLCRPSTADEA